MSSDDMTAEGLCPSNDCTSGAVPHYYSYDNAVPYIYMNDDLVTTSI